MISFDGRRIMCLGDVMLDRFFYGQIDRISPEAPVPVVRMKENRAMLGGVGNVARNIASLGGEAVLIGLVGEDLAGREIAALIEETGGIIDANIRSRTRPTIAKTRIIASQQHVVRLDEETADAIGSDEAAIAGARALGMPVLVDPKRDDFAFYAGATVMTPNLKELKAAARCPLETDEQVAEAAQRLMADAGVESILVTRSEKGMLLADADGSIHAVPAIAKEVFDVSGAGDTVIAVVALSLAAGQVPHRAMRIANSAAGVVVSKLGTATLSLDELISAVEADAQEGADGGKLVSAGQAASIIEAWQRRGLTAGLTNGCFDILHRGHVTMLQAARDTCDRLVVALNTDDSVRRLKGQSRPINGLEDRASVIAALRPVDLVVCFSEDTPLQLITQLQPDVLFKGADYTVDTVVGADVVLARGGRVELLDLVPGRSTSNIIARSQAMTHVAAE
jgi:D-beta-D-heptose 7-phosphate kinase/D-beta-D-heptose 1-phosphate adenosyltransferase